MKFLIIIAVLFSVKVRAGELKKYGTEVFPVMAFSLFVTNAEDNSRAKVAFSWSRLESSPPDYNIDIERIGTNYLFFKKNLTVKVDGESFQCTDPEPMEDSRSIRQNAKHERGSFASDEKCFSKMCQAKSIDLLIDGEKGSTIYHIDSPANRKGFIEMADLIANGLQIAKPAKAQSSNNKNSLTIVSFNTKITEKTEPFWRFAYKIDVKSTDGCKERAIHIQFLDKEGFSLADAMELNINLEPGETKTITGSHLIDPKIASNVSKTQPEVK